jgi:hypothetical protein
MSPAWASELTSCTPPSPRAGWGVAPPIARGLSERERRPESPSRLSHGEPEHLAPPISANDGGDHYRLRDDAVIHSGLAVGGAEEHAQELLLDQGTITVAPPPPDRGSRGPTTPPT